MEEKRGWTGQREGWICLRSTSTTHDQEARAVRLRGRNEHEDERACRRWRTRRSKDQGSQVGLGEGRSKRGRRTSDHRQRQRHHDVERLVGPPGDVGGHEASDEGHACTSRGRRRSARAGRAERQAPQHAPPWAIDKSCVSRVVKPKLLMTMLPKADAPPLVRQLSTCRTKKSQSAGSRRASYSCSHLNVLRGRGAARRAKDAHQPLNGQR